MRHAAGRRHRNRGHGGGNNNNNNNGNRRGNHNRMQVFDSNGPDVRIRGTAHQVVEKYLALAKDSASAGDRVLAESYLQHAEHYQRIISTWEEESPARFEQSTASAPFLSSSPAPNLPQDIGTKQSADLSLPASILGAPSKAETQEQAPVRTTELTS